MARDASLPAFSRSWHADQLPPISQLLVTMAVTLANWEQRKRSRLALSRLDTHLLKDIGLTPSLSRTEIEKPFWQN